MKSGSDLKNIEKSAAETLDRATDAEKKAIAALNEVKNLIVPNTNITAIRKEAETTKEEALALINATSKLNENNDLLREEIREQSASAQDLLDQGKEQQIAISDLLSAADFAHSMAENAVNLSDETLSEAKKTLNTLSGNSILTIRLIHYS